MTTDLRFTRVFDAPRSLVFTCMTTPEHLTHFWGPTGTSAPRDGIEIDCRPGGTFAVRMENANGSSYLMRVVFDRVQEPELLVWTDVDSGMRTTSTFSDLGDDRTEVEIRQELVPAPFHSPEVQAGFRTSLDRFDVYLRSLAARGSS